MNGRTETSAELGRWDRIKELPPKFSERAPDESWQVPKAVGNRIWHNSSKYARQH
jgi:hypothetical protein